MTTFQPGDRVRVVIEDAVVTEVQWHAGAQYVTARYADADDPNTEVSVYPDLVTVTKVAPQPKAGDVWEGVRHKGSESSTKRAVWIIPAGGVRASGPCIPLDMLDFTDARCVYPIDQAGDCETCSGNGELYGYGDSSWGCQGCDGTGNATPSASIGRCGESFAAWSGDASIFVCDRSYGHSGEHLGYRKVDQDETTAPAMLRRIEDRKAHEWIETAPGSGRYNYLARRLEGGKPIRRAHVKSIYGIARDLPPVRVGEVGKA